MPVVTAGAARATAARGRGRPTIPAFTTGRYFLRLARRGPARAAAAEQTASHSGAAPAGDSTRSPMRNAFPRIVFAALVGALVVPSARAQGAGGFLHEYVTTTRIADPKLDHGGVQVDYRLDPDAAPYIVQITAHQNGKKVSDVWRGMESGRLLPLSHFWSGVDSNGKFVDPGRYSIRVEAQSSTGGRSEAIHYPVDV